jgi:hypothetical protein
MRLAVLIVVATVVFGAHASSAAAALAPCKLTLNEAGKVVNPCLGKPIRKQRCLIEADGKVLFTGPCFVRHDPRRQAVTVDPPRTVITSVGRHRNQPFVVSFVDGDITWSNGMIWEGAPYGTNHAHTSFGDMSREGSCWVTRAKPRFEVPTHTVRGRVCAQ